ncbi:hypothetical protein ATJ97_1242 [Georgenia soli]|uniref:Histidinol dehydrogenase n=1 Tax=Georgenia soli TaxID=638953 RepID=A0A2A9EKH5_9MICO|nr:DUF6113 family protein [Georgenia soli]PFG38755.1 hypothetical protein ATJ97_1242 [Georgenia soli]
MSARTEAEGREAGRGAGRGDGRDAADGRDRADRRDRGDRAGHVVAAVVAVVAGVVVGAAGTLVHRWTVDGLPVGVVTALVVVLLGGVFARSAADGVGVFLLGLAGVLTTLTMTFVSPNGDVLVTDQPLSFVWLLGMPLVAGLAMLTPRGWYSDEPVPRRRAAR